MVLKDIKYYYNELKPKLADGSNAFIKKYTTIGFIKSREMWAKYSHKSYEDFFNDFNKDYSDEYLEQNCDKCYQEMVKSNPTLKREDLYDLLIRRLVLDCFIGFKAEEVLKDKLKEYGVTIEDREVVSRQMEETLDTRYNVDILTFNGPKVTNIIQVKNLSTFSSNSPYMCGVRKEFLLKEAEVNKFLGTNLHLVYYVYDKQSFIDTGEFKFAVNPNNDKLYFGSRELFNSNGTLIINVKNCNKRTLSENEKNGYNQQPNSKVWLQVVS